MFRQTGRAVRPSVLRRAFSQATSAPRRKTGRNLALISATAVTATIAWQSTPKAVVHSDAPSVTKEKSVLPTSASTELEDDTLSTIVWGSNKSNVLSPTTPGLETIKSPSVAGWLKDVALRDLALHRAHAACIDARGDVYQWGDKFFGEVPSQDNKPVLTLRNKDIVSLQLSESRLFALSSSGNVYVLPADISKQNSRDGASPSSQLSWWDPRWLWRESPTIDFAEISAAEPLSWREKFVSISAGRDHLLALTSDGRTFAHPLTKNANSHGQLGIRSIDIPYPSSSARHSIQLIPKSILDPFAKESRATRPQTSVDPLADVDDQNIRFCDKLFEIPSLKDVKIAQIATGGRSSFARTGTGRVLGWGANDFGQIGLGNNVTLDTITVPTEIVLWKGAPTSSRTKCFDIVAGGDLTCFAVERIGDSSQPSTVDLLLCGNGQWGGLGNNQFSNAQGSPVRAKNVSGILEYSDKSKTLEALRPHAISVSPSGHVLLTLDTLLRSGGNGGRDLVVWGANYEYELGLGKRGSIASPTSLHRADGGRFMLGAKKAKQVKDMSGKVWRKGAAVEQCALAGDGGSSIVYWKLC